MEEAIFSCNCCDAILPHSKEGIDDLFCAPCLCNQQAYPSPSLKSLKPQMRWSPNHLLVPISWDLAYQRMASVMRNLPNSSSQLGFYLSAQNTNETFYLTRKIAKNGIKTPHVYLCDEGDFYYKAQYYQSINQSFPKWIPNTDFQHTDCVVLIVKTNDFYKTSLYKKLSLYKQQHPKIKIIWMADGDYRGASIADFKLILSIDQDVLLLEGLLAYLYYQGFRDDFLSAYPIFFKGLKSKLSGKVLRKYFKQKGIAWNRVKKLIKILLKAKHPTGHIASNLYALKVEQQTESLLQILLQWLSGTTEAPLLYPTACRHNEQGAYAMGIYPFVDVNQEVPVSFLETLSNGDLKVLWIIGRTALDFLSYQPFLMERLSRRLNFVILQHPPSLQQIPNYVDLFLPTLDFSKEEGTFINRLGQLVYQNKFAVLENKMWSNSKILLRFAKEMAFRGFDYKYFGIIFSEIAFHSKGKVFDHSMINFSNLTHSNGFSSPIQMDIKARQACKHVHQIAPPNVVHHQSFRLRLRYSDAQPYQKEFSVLLMSAADAEQHEFSDGDLVCLKNEQGSLQIPLKISSKLTSAAMELVLHPYQSLPVSFTMFFKDCLPPKRRDEITHLCVDLQQVVKPVENIVIIGAGVATYEFVKAYRTKNVQDHLYIFSKSSPDKLFIKQSQFEAFPRVTVFLKNKVSSIHPKQRYILDKDSKKKYYDHLILSMGSRPFSDVTLNIQTCFVARNYNDINPMYRYLKQLSKLEQQHHVVIAGGGLLGVSVAFDLLNRGIQVTLVQRSTRLMERQLDTVSHELLLRYLMEKGVVCYFENEIATVFEQAPQSLLIELKTGIQLIAVAVIYATGVLPNTALAKQAGIKTIKGVVINEQLQTNYPNIYAIGEVSETAQGQLGLGEDASKRQSAVLARFIMGDYNANYEGVINSYTLDTAQFPIFGMGLVRIEPDNPNYEVITTLNSKRYYYRKFVIDANRLVGVILCGDIVDVQKFQQLIRNKTILSDTRKECYC